jgi:hypothetical protein
MDRWDDDDVSVRRYACAVVALGVLLAGCVGRDAGSDDGAPTPEASDVGTTAAPFEGTWDGTWTRTAPVAGGGDLGLVLHQEGSTISGTYTATGGVCLTSGTISGAVDDITLTMKLVSPGTDSDFTGTLSGDTISGNLSASCSGGVGTGEWTVTRSDG